MQSIDQIALGALLADGFVPQLDANAEAQLAAIKAKSESAERGVRDMRPLLWSSIDNTESRDLDQIEFVEQQADGSIRILIGIADVDWLITRNSPLDQHAFANATSVYTGVKVFPMLPEQVSTNATSLNEAEDRLALVVEIILAKDGTVASHDVFRALVRNKAKLAYESIGPWLEGSAAPPAQIDTNDELQQQVWLQDRAAGLLKMQREKAGALEFETIEASPVAKDGRIERLAVTRKNRARDLIEDFMIAANVAIAQILAERNRSAIRRVVRTPKRWNRIVEIARSYNTTLPDEPDPKALAGFLAARRAADPRRFTDLSLAIVKLLGPGEYVVDRPGPSDDQGHFGLAANDYSHATAPNRRYADLVTQRLIKATISQGAPPYSDEELEKIAAQCTERENAANHVERKVRKAAAAELLSPRVGSVFDAIVTGVNKDGTYVRLLSPPAEGRVTRNEEGMDVGERVRVRLINTNPQKGYIDFEGVTGH